jgi:3-deoxy-D-manno-octulosonate 8-phosphate phosphatase (KDO 8-P phosphatase)
MLASQSKKKSILIIGAGNVATHIALRLQKTSYHLKGIVSKRYESAKALADLTNCTAYANIDEAQCADIYIYAVSDSAINSVAVQMNSRHSQSLHLHTAGSIGIDVFENKDIDLYGSLYPLQTFSRNKTLDFAKIPLFIEGNCKESTEKILTLANELSDYVYLLDSEKRKYLHLSAVFACNFTNHCICMCEKIAKEAGIDSELFNTLIKETFDKLSYISANEAQTGPARRWDQNTISLHLQMLTKYPNEQRIYKIMSENIYKYSKSKNEQDMINYDLKKIKAIALDVDGVLSANNVLLIGDGRAPHRTANIKDGYAIQLAVKCGLELAIITGGKSEEVRERYLGLGVQNVYSGISVKIDCFKDWMLANQLKPEEVLYMGDDIPDYEVLKVCGLPCCPADAAQEIKDICLYISDKTGGNGCARDVIEQVLKAQDKWMANAEAFGW